MIKDSPVSLISTVELGLSYVDFGIRVIPSVIFLFFAWLRFREIRPLGFSKLTVYSRFFNTKLAMQYFQAALEFMIMMMFLTNYAYLHSMRGTMNKERAAPLLSLLNFAAWIISGKFLVYEYRKRLSEGFLTHQLFWTLSFGIDAMLTINNYQLYVNCRYLITNVYRKFQLWY